MENILEEYGYTPLEHIELPDTNDTIIALIHNRTFIFIKDTKEEIVKYDYLVLAVGELGSDGIYDFEDVDEQGFYRLKPCGYFTNKIENNGPVRLEIGGKDNRETCYIDEIAAVAYYVIKTEPVITGKSMFRYGEKSEFIKDGDEDDTV